MSVTTVPLGVLLLAEQHGLLGRDESVCDFGSMEFDSREPANNLLFEALFRSHGKEIPSEFYDPDDGRLYGIAGDLWRALGWGYTSYDIDGRFGSLELDLNVDQIPNAERERYSLTMNIGTSEHVFNQDNFFRQFHHVTRVGGLMLHIVPFHAYANHGLYSYSPVFFFSLAYYNGYDVLGAWHCTAPRHDIYHSFLTEPIGKRVPLVVLMRRARAGEFALPFQVNHHLILGPRAGRRHGKFVPRTLDDLRPTGELPESFYLETATATVRPGPIPAEVLEALTPTKKKRSSKAETAKKAMRQAAERG